MEWLIKSKIKSVTPAKRYEEIISSILKNRDIKTKSAISNFLSPLPPSSITPREVGIDEKNLKKVKALIETAISQKTPIIVYGDYDADGITATAILWEALRSLGADTLPFIPSRESHGYGLSVKGLEDALALTPQKPLIITVDNGIVAVEAVTWLKQRQIDVIITDHHQPGEELPPADVIIHSTEICGAGVAWMVATYLNSSIADSILDLVCIGTISDMMPLTSINRRFVSHGLEAVRQSKRVGLTALFKQAEIDLGKPIDTYHINYIIAPRLNAMGRLEHALDSLRLLCTNNSDRADKLATLLSSTNRNRQDITQELLELAIQKINPQVDKDRIIILDDPSFHEGVIGLIAGKIAEKYYRPTIIISHKSGVSKASARSIRGINITELIRSQSQLLLGVGGHPMAAGFSIETDKINEFKKSLTKYANRTIDDKLLLPSISIDCEINQTDINQDLYQLIQQLQPFGIGNPQPVFSMHNIPIKDMKIMGNAQQHLKLLIEQPDKIILQALWFNHGSDAAKYQDDKTINLAFTINQNVWRGNTSLQLVIKSLTAKEA